MLWIWSVRSGFGLAFKALWTNLHKTNVDYKILYIQHLNGYINFGMWKFHMMDALTLLNLKITSILRQRGKKAFLVKDNERNEIMKLFLQ